MFQSRDPLDVADDELATALKVLASTTRLRVLSAIKKPTPMRDIRVPPESSRSGDNPTRPVSVQVVQQHLKRLEKVGLVQETGADRHYVVNRPRLYALAESFRQLAALRGDHTPLDNRTIVLESPGAAAPVRGPRLVLVHGAYEGKAYALDPSFAVDGQWIIGRRPGLPVCLDYDPYVSREHAVVSEGAAAFTIRPLPGTRNPTAVNWSQLHEDHEHVLSPGDVIGIGRSLLVFSDS